MKLSRRSLLAGSGALTTTALLPGCARSETGVLRAADTHPAGYPTVEAVRHMGDLLQTRSNGRLRIELYPGSVLGQEKGTLEITIFGGLDFNRVNLAPLNSIVPETIVASLPFIFDSVAHMRAAMDGAPGRAILDALEPHGLIGLCFYDSGSRSLYTTSRSIEAPEDLRGLKIRVQSSDLSVAMIEALGGNPTPMDFGEVYQGLLQGTVDGAENNWPSYESTRHFEAAPYYSLTQHVIAPEVLTMSARSFYRLAEADRDLVRECSRDSVPVMRRLWDARVQRSREIVAAAGNTITDPDPAAFRERMAPVWDRFLATPQLRRLSDDIRNAAPLASGPRG